MQPTVTAEHAPADPFSGSRRPACLPMYDLPEVRGHTDRLWRELRPLLAARGVDRLPGHLDHVIDPHRAWHHPDLLLAQTCGYPLVTELAGRVRYLGTPCYRATGCEGPLYRSRLVVREHDTAAGIDDLRGRRLVINSADSLSGSKAMQLAIGTQSPIAAFFESVATSGSHVASIAHVARSLADVAAIDCVTWALLSRHRPDALEGVRILVDGPLLPGLPLITSISTSEAAFDALRNALTELIAVHRGSEFLEALMLVDIAWDMGGAYDGILDRLSPTGSWKSDG